MNLTPSLRRGNSPRSGLALTPEQAGRQLHHFEERLQAVEQALADQRRALEEGLRLNRRLQAHRDVYLWDKIEGLSEQVQALEVEPALPENQV